MELFDIIVWLAIFLGVWCIIVSIGVQLFIQPLTAFGKNGAIILLSCVDSILTLKLLSIDSSITELNPVMDQLINISPILFVVIKLIMTTFGVIILYRYQHMIFMGLIKVKHISTGLLFVYCALVSYELFLLYNIFSGS